MPIIPSRRRTAPIKTGLAIRVDLTSGAQIGPGKVQLLEEISRTGSISAGGRAMNMSFRQAWTLVDGMNETFGPVVATSIGGVDHGGARLTEVGKALVVEYRAIEDAAAAASREHLQALRGGLPREVEIAVPGPQAFYCWPNRLAFHSFTGDGPQRAGRDIPTYDRGHITM